MHQLSKKIHDYQTVHGHTPEMEIRDKLAQDSFQNCISQYTHFFKIMEIRYFKLFIDELY